MLLSIPCKFENELLKNYNSYQEKYLSLNLTFQDIIQSSTNLTINETRHIFQNQFNIIMIHILEDLVNNITSQIANIFTKQLDALKLTPPTFSQHAILNLPEEQYIVYNIIVFNLGSL